MLFLFSPFCHVFINPVQNLGFHKKSNFGKYLNSSIITNLSSHAISKWNTYWKFIFGQNRNRNKAVYALCKMYIKYISAFWLFSKNRPLHVFSSLQTIKSQQLYPAFIRTRKLQTIEHQIQIQLKNSILYQLPSHF